MEGLPLGGLDDAARAACKDSYDRITDPSCLAKSYARKREEREQAERAKIARLPPLAQEVRKLSQIDTSRLDDDDDDTTLTCFKDFCDYVQQSSPEYDKESFETISKLVECCFFSPRSRFARLCLKPNPLLRYAEVLVVAWGDLIFAPGWGDAKDLAKDSYYHVLVESVRHLPITNTARLGLLVLEGVPYDAKAPSMMLPASRDALKSHYDVHQDCPSPKERSDQLMENLLRALRSEDPTQPFMLLRRMHDGFRCEAVESYIVDHLNASLIDTIGAHLSSDDDEAKKTANVFAYLAPTLVKRPDDNAKRCFDRLFALVPERDARDDHVRIAQIVHIYAQALHHTRSQRREGAQLVGRRPVGGTRADARAPQLLFCQRLQLLNLLTRTLRPPRVPRVAFGLVLGPVTLARHSLLLERRRRRRVAVGADSRPRRHRDAPTLDHVETLAAHERLLQYVHAL